MTVKFLGTSACWPLPRLGCQCPICTSGDPRDKRTRASILINNSTLIDCGPDFYHQFSSSLTSNSQLLTSVIITHVHFDHIFGLFDAGKIYHQDCHCEAEFIEAEAISSGIASSPGGHRDPRNDNKNKIKLYATKPTMQVIQDFFGIHLVSFEIHQVKENLIFEVDKMKVALFPVKHGVTPTYGVKIKADKLLAYVPDFSRILPSNKRLIKDMDILILDGSSLGKIGQAHGHISIEEGISIGKELKAKKIYFTHIGHKTGKHEVLEDFVKEKGGGNFYIGFDGLEIKI